MKILKITVEYIIGKGQNPFPQINILGNFRWSLKIHH